MFTFIFCFSIFVKADFDFQGLTYHVLESETNEVQVVNCSITNSTLVIPPTVENEQTKYTVISIATEAFSSSNISLFETIYFPYTLSDIESRTFMEFPNLKRIGYINENYEQINDTLPPLITKLNSYVFQSCKYITNIDFNNVVEIGTRCFENCIRLTNVNLRVVEIIGPYALASIQLLQNIELPKTLKQIQDYAFVKTALVNVTGEVPNLETIITGFYLCSDLVRVPEFPGLLHFESQAFASCYNLKEIHCGPKLETIYSSSFMGCRSLEIFTTESTNYLISGEAFSHCTSLKTFVFDGATEILNNAFEACESLDVIDLSRSQIEFVNWQVFEDCGDLSSVILPPKITDFSLFAFDGCNIHSITFTGTADTLDLTEAFSYYDGDLYEVIFDPSCNVILDSAFKHCYNLSHVVLPTTNYTLVGTFSNCANLSHIENLKYCTSITSSAFLSCSKLAQIDSFDSLTELGAESFTKCSSLTSIPSLPLIQSIGQRCFQNCFQLKSFKCGSHLSIIGEEAFSGCFSLESFEKEVHQFVINSSAFEFCSSLKSFDFTYCTKIEDSAFDSCSSLVEADFSKASFTQIGFLAFSECTSLSKIIFPRDLQMIENMCFYYCTSLTSLDFTNTNSYFSIFSNAFEGCSSLKTIHFEKQPFIIFSSAFASCTALESIELDTPSSFIYTEIQDSAFENCSSLTHFDFKNWYINSIGKYAFHGCPLSKTIKFRGRSLLPDNLSIGSFAFSSSKIKTVDFRFDFDALFMTNQTFAECPNLKCVMVDNSLKDQFTTFFKKSYLNGIHCSNYLTANTAILIALIAGCIVLVIVIAIIITCIVKKKKKKQNEGANIATPLITYPTNQYQ